MTAEHLRALNRATPFIPFDIHLADSRTIAVKHPETLLIPPGSRIVVVADADGVLEIVDLLLVVSLRPRAPGKSKVKKSSNGQAT